MPAIPSLPVVVSDEADALAIRYLDSVDNPDPAMLEALACDFSEVYGPGSFAAARLRERAAYLRCVAAF